MHEIIGEAIKRGDQLEIEAIIVADEHGTHLAAVPVLAALPAAIVGLLKHPEKVVPTNKFEEYRRNPDDCRRKAEDTDDTDDKTSWLKLADAWLQILPPPIHSRGLILRGGPRHLMQTARLRTDRRFPEPDLWVRDLVYVRFGSKADMCNAQAHVCFASESRHWSA